MRAKHFSFKVSLLTVGLAAVMLWCANWQWNRYHFKKALEATYEENAATPPLPLDLNQSVKEYESLKYRRVTVSGTYDYEHQLLLTNRKHATGPGHWLVTPLQAAGSHRCLLVSRGFIPFEDLSREQWQKYNFEPAAVTVDGVVQPSSPARLLGPRNPEAGPELAYQTRWFFMELDKMARQIPCPVVTEFYLQALNKPPLGQFPAPSVTIDVPPQTHFGYTIEWIVLACVTLLVGFGIQLLRRPPQGFPPPKNSVQEEGVNAR